MKITKDGWAEMEHASEDVPAAMHNAHLMQSQHRRTNNLSELLAKATEVGFIVSFSPSLNAIGVTVTKEGFEIKRCVSRRVQEQGNIDLLAFEVDRAVEHLKWAEEDRKLAKQQRDG